MSKGFQLIDETPAFLVVAKDAGVPFHARGEEAGLCGRVREHMGQVYPVHRLDEATSGLLLLARNSAAARDLAALFRERNINKYYLALSDLQPRKKQGLIQGDMVRSRRGDWKLTRAMTNPARTRFVSWSVSPGLRLYLLKPLTGRTHQLRVAMKSLGAPILGDRRYHPLSTPWPDRTYLHAYALNFRLHGQNYSYHCTPQSGDTFQLPEITNQLELLGDPHSLSWPGK